MTAIKDQDTLKEAIKLLTFTENITLAWSTDNIDITEETLQGLFFLISQAKEKIQKACG